jgi:hypothetical protein
MTGPPVPAADGAVGDRGLRSGVSKFWKGSSTGKKIAMGLGGAVVAGFLGFEAVEVIGDMGGDSVGDAASNYDGSGMSDATSGYSGSGYPDTSGYGGDSYGGGGGGGGDYSELVIPSFSTNLLMARKIC